MKFLLIYLSLLTVGCTQIDESFVGMWSYKNSENEYAEMWFNKEQVILIDKTSYMVELFDYVSSSDSVYLCQGTDTIYSVGYRFNSSSELYLGNQYLQSVLSKITTVVPEDFIYTDSLVIAVRKEFAARANNID